MKSLVSVQMPSNLLFFDTETKGTISPENKSIVRHSLWFGNLQAFRYVKGKVTREISRFFETVEEFWSYLETRLDKSRPLHVFTHNLGFDLTIVDFWQKSEQLEFDFEYCVLEDPPTFLTVSWKGCKIIFVDTLNYWRTSLAEIGKSFGVEKLSMPSWDEPIEKWKTYCARDVKIIAQAVTGLMDYLTENNLGSFAMTAPSIAMNVFKHRFMQHDVFIHDNLSALSLERDSYYGGLVQCFFLGTVSKGMVYCLDVNSLYPSVMVGEFPVKMIGNKANPPLRELRSKANHYGIAARVDIDTDSLTYPIKFEGRLLDVQGKFTTTLCGPELIKALANNHVVKCYSMAWYEMKKLFNPFVTYFWRERQKYKETGDDVKQIFCKLLMNSLYGKFGQRGYEWVDITPDTIKALYKRYNRKPPEAYLKGNFQPKVLWAQSKWFPADLPESVTVRAVNGYIQMRIIAGEHYESMPIISGYVTSYARERLRGLIATAGPKHTYYCDTDSLFVDETGYSNLLKAGEVNPKELGKLKLESSSDNTTFYGPKDYIFGDKVVRKGIRKEAIELSEGEFLQNQFEGLKSVLKREPLPYIEIAWIIKQNKRDFKKGVKGKNGWVLPFNVERDLGVV